MTFHFVEFIFYFLTTFFLWYEFLCISDSTYILSFVEKMKIKNGTRLNVKENKILFISCLYPFWTFIGLFSSQFVLFICLTILTFVSIYINKFYNSIFKKWFLFDSIISAILLILIVLNKFYFKIL